MQHSIAVLVFLIAAAWSSPAQHRQLTLRDPLSPGLVQWHFPKVGEEEVEDETKK